MRLSTFLLTTSAAVGAYVAARRLMDDAGVIERLPKVAQGPAVRLRARLQRARDVFADGFREGRAERDEAERELMQEYHRRAQR
ncbi:MAG: hypothetical protein WC273_07340 [Dehalococcoidia bacterium]